MTGKVLTPADVRGISKTCSGVVNLLDALVSGLADPEAMFDQSKYGTFRAEAIELFESIQGKGQKISALGCKISNFARDQKTKILK